MCKKLLFFWFVFLWLCLSTGALRAEEPGWYLISEAELLGIETSLGRLETDRQKWELQARGLKNEAGSLNSQLAEERRQYRTLEQSFNKLEADLLMRLSLKDGETAALKQTIADKTLEAEKWKSKTIPLILVIIMFLAVTACLIFIRIKRKN
jgi:lipopolysaccharide export LptBFGC system permease protein LptF